MRPAAVDCFKRNLLPHFLNEQLTRLHRVAGQVSCWHRHPSTPAKQRLLFCSTYMNTPTPSHSHSE
jgi:hypothetical protein